MAAFSALSGPALLVNATAAANGEAFVSGLALILALTDAGNTADCLPSANETHRKLPCINRC